MNTPDTTALTDFDFAQLARDYTPQAVAFGLKLVAVLFLFLVAWIVAGRVQRALVKGLPPSRVDPTLTKFAANISRWLIVVAAALACLGVFGVETTSFAAVLGASALAVGLALQGSLSHLASGVMLLMFRPFKVGDIVNIGGEVGVVDEIGLLMTNLDTFDNRRLYIPNGQIFGSKIENIAYHPVRRVDIAVGTDYGADLAHVRACLEKACIAVPGQAEGKDPQVWLAGFGDSAIDWSVRVWVPSPEFGASRQKLIESIKTELDRGGVGIPFPQMDVHFDEEKGEKATAKAA